MIETVFESQTKDFTLIQGDTLKVLNDLQLKFDMIFADPPYFLSNGGISLRNGKVTCVDKGDWDKPDSVDSIDEFNKSWISACRNVLKDNGTIWVTGTYHNIFSVGKQLAEQGFKILNVVTWVKTNPPENISHRMLTFSSEFVIWAKKMKRSYHRYNYEQMKALNGDKQLTDVWVIPAVQKWEKTCGKHPTQKPLALLSRIIMASTNPGDMVLDPFAGSCTTGIASNLLDRKFVGIEKEQAFLDLGIRRRNEIDDATIFAKYQQRLMTDFVKVGNSKKEQLVLIGRVGSEAQWEWMMKAKKYNLPASKVLSVPELISAEYVLVYKTGDLAQVVLFRKNTQKILMKSKQQIAASSRHKYEPNRDEYYWLLPLAQADDVQINTSCFNKSRLLKGKENNGAYWVKPLSDVLGAFDDNMRL